MVKRLSMFLMIMILAIVALLLAAKNPTGPNTVSFDEPLNLLMSLGTLILLLLPPLILSFFNHLVLNIISAIYQAFIVLTFLGLIIVGFVIPSIWIIAIGTLGTIVGITSIVITILEGLKKVEKSNSYN
ncbi:hypothetical protein [Oceanobacillus chungangensis]|uniref:Uncharacterized protein n=1 Tax=Oceanobacillus chungangensis TaxID=1229152 RepID=A0A3D8Q2Y8_9BACI|nr:hypothetical protein [Oceanobacillus chungangensis]RDW22101.1 hypothetical protein CWR45_01025 [Oceanobacillus chungangensis]